jgi:hypothetical protein
MFMLAGGLHTYMPHNLLGGALPTMSMETATLWAKLSCARKVSAQWPCLKTDDVHAQLVGPTGSTPQCLDVIVLRISFW